MTRVCIYFDSAARATEQLLRPEQQLVPSQGEAMFAYTVGNHMSTRPEGFRPSDVSHTLDALRKKHGLSSRAAAPQDMDTTMTDVAGAQPAAASGSDCSDEEKDSEESEPAEVRQLGPAKSSRITEKEQKALAKKEKQAAKKAADKAARATKKEKGKASGARADFADVEVRSGCSRGSAGATGSTAGAVREAVDDELAEAADAHLNSGKGSSVKCLAILRVEHFIRGPVAAGPDAITAKTLSNAINGVHSSDIE